MQHALQLVAVAVVVVVVWFIAFVWVTAVDGFLHFFFLKKICRFFAVGLYTGSLYTGAQYTSI